MRHVIYLPRRYVVYTLTLFRRLVLDDYFLVFSAGCAGIVVGYPFDTIKVHIQTQDHRNPKYRGTWHCFRTLVARESVNYYPHHFILHFYYNVLYEEMIDVRRNVRGKNAQECEKYVNEFEKRKCLRKSKHLSRAFLISYIFFRQNYSPVGVYLPVIFNTFLSTYFYLQKCKEKREGVNKFLNL